MAIRPYDTGKDRAPPSLSKSIIETLHKSAYNTYGNEHCSQPGQLLPRPAAATPTKPNRFPSLDA